MSIELKMQPEAILWGLCRDPSPSRGNAKYRYVVGDMIGTGREAKRSDGPNWNSA